jgi:hypothetical protein
MQQTTQITRPTRRLLSLWSHLSKAILCGVLLCCSACFEHKITIDDGYRLRENSGAPMLVPIGGQSSDLGMFQTSEITLPGDSATRKNRVKKPCEIKGEVFSLRSSSFQHWIVRSPSTSGWNTLVDEIDIDLQWRTFTRQIARMDDNGCFPAGLAAVDIQLAIAQKIPLPANEVPLFFYSEQGMGIINLAPGMEVRLQKILPTGKSLSAGSREAFHMRLANYEVIPRHGGGVRLKLTQRVQSGPKIGSMPNEKEMFTLSQQFASAHALRLVLKGFTGNRPESDAILLGASDDKQLNVISKLIFQTDPTSCVNYRGSVCMEFPRDALSLFSTIWINGRRTSYPFGTPLAAVLRSLPQPQQSSALESLRVFRRLSPNHYAEIEFPRTQRGAAQVLLLPQDRIQWKN